MDYCCPHGNWPAHSNVAKSQTSSTQFSCNKLIKKRLPPLVLKQPNSSPASETSDKKARREKKKYYHQVQAWRDSIPPATSVNVTNTPGKIHNGGDW